MYSKALIMILRFRVHPKPLKYISHFLFSKTKLNIGFYYVFYYVFTTFIGNKPSLFTTFETRF